MQIVFVFFNDTATTEIYTLSLHDALPIFQQTAQDPQAVKVKVEHSGWCTVRPSQDQGTYVLLYFTSHHPVRSEEHTSELQSRQYFVCRLLLEKKKNIHYILAPLS